MSGLKSYDNGTKNTWRGWVWNRIVERLDKDPSEATAIYLVGPEDRDRDTAIAKGFRNENLIAVDLDPENVRRVRERGGFAICADLNDVVQFWNDRPVDVLVADFCGGLTQPAISFALVSSVYNRAISKGAVVAVNLLAGRETGGFRECVSLFKSAIKSADASSDGIIPAHRGLAWLFTAMCFAVSEMSRSDRDTAKSACAMYNACEPIARSYISKAGKSRLRFDTAVMRWNMPTLRNIPELCSFPSNPPERVKRDMANLKAMRTRLADDAQRRYWERRRQLEVTKG
jgi:hypothetical protein